MLSRFLCTALESWHFLLLHFPYSFDVIFTNFLINLICFVLLASNGNWFCNTCLVLSLPL